MNELNFKLTVNEANTILQALGNMPFVQVYPLIQKLQQQAAQQMEGNLEAPKPQEAPATASTAPTAAGATQAAETVEANGEAVLAH